MHRSPTVEPPRAIRAAVDPPRDCQMSPSVASLSGKAGSPHRRAHDFDMRAAAAQIVAQCFLYLGLGRMRASRQQRLDADDHAVEAVAALRGLFGNKSLLHGIGMRARGEAT